VHFSLKIFHLLSVYNIQLRNIDRAKYIVCPTNSTVGSATALPAYYGPTPLSGSCDLCVLTPLRSIALVGLEVLGTAYSNFVV